MNKGRIVQVVGPVVDVEFPEAVRALALAGAELVAVPTALIEPFDIVSRTLVPARAFENQVYVANAGICARRRRCGPSTGAR